MIALQVFNTTKIKEMKKQHYKEIKEDILKNLKWVFLIKKKNAEMKRSIIHFSQYFSLVFVQDAGREL